MKAIDLFELTRPALCVTGLPVFASPEEPDELEALVCVKGDDDEPVWALVPCEDASTASCGATPVNFEDDFLALDAGLAAELVKSRLRDWLLQRGWQVQVSVRKGTRTWRLVDCLSFSDGGGDRLNSDYPFGGEELGVLVQSVVSLGSNA